MHLDAQPIAAGVRLATYDEIGSTNAEALNLARTGERGPLWLIARAQVVGRGRHGRTWVSDPGNLYATLLLTDPMPAGRAPEQSLVAALPGHDAEAEAAPVLRNRLSLKWPNDLLADGRKLAGILIEGEGTGIAIGIGVNCRHHPHPTGYPATDLGAVGADVSADELFPILSRTMFVRLALWEQGAGFATIREDWLARCADVGRHIRVRIGDSEHEGRFEALDADGRLLLRRADGALETISAGDVFPVHLSSYPPLKGEGRIAAGDPGWGHSSA
jgi:BirA family biotin operon repressor/biotin-[acetyl-CoA-carboxylase] ligase